MKIGLPIELLSFEWVRRLKQDITQVLPDVQFCHVALHKRGGMAIPLSEGDASFPFK